MPKLIIGCGHTQRIYTNPLHKDNPEGDRVTYWEKKHSHSSEDVTMDIQPLMSPNIIGNVATTDNDLYNPEYNQKFDSIWFERVPTSIFTIYNQCNNALGIAFRVLKIGGLLSIRSGENLKAKTGGPLQKMLEKNGFDKIQILNEKFVTAQKLG